MDVMAGEVMVSSTARCPRQRYDSCGEDLDLSASFLSDDLEIDETASFPSGVFVFDESDSEGYSDSDDDISLSECDTWCHNGQVGGISKSTTGLERLDTSTDSWECEVSVCSVMDITSHEWAYDVTDDDVSDDETWDLGSQTDNSTSLFNYKCTYCGMHFHLYDSVTSHVTRRHVGSRIPSMGEAGVWATEA